MEIIWEKITPEGVSHMGITREFFEMRTSDDECRFWNGFCGGTCRRSMRRFVPGMGYVWTRITRRDPQGRRYIDNFHFED